MWNKFILLFFLGLSLIAQGQDTVLEQDVNQQLENMDQGLGSAKHLMASSNKFGFYLSSNYENDSIRTKSGSFVFDLGMQELWRMGSHFMVGYNWEYQFNIFKIRQDSGVNLLSINLEHDKQNLSIHQMNFGPVFRIKLKNKGNKIGQYIDLGAYGSINFGYSLFSRDQVDPTINNGARTIETKQLRLDYINRWSYGVEAVLGQNSLNFWAKYRLSNSFKTSNNINNGNLLPELPRLFLGIGFSVASIPGSKVNE